MANISLNNDQLYNLDKPIEPAKIVGTGETYANVGAVPSTLLYPGKHIYDKDNEVLYIVDASGTPVAQNKADIIESSFTGIYVLTQTEYDELTEPIETVLYLIKEEPESKGDSNSGA